MGISLSVRPGDQQLRELAVRFYSEWYCAAPRVDVLARRFRLASNRYIVCESANVKVFQYQARKLMSNIFFLKYFTSNNVLSFLYIIFNEKSFIEKFLDRGNI